MPLQTATHHLAAQAACIEAEGLVLGVVLPEVAALGIVAPGVAALGVVPPHIPLSLPTIFGAR